MALAIPTKLDRQLVAHIDELVAEGLYLSRSEAIREGVRRLVGERYLSINDFKRTLARISAALLVEGLGSELTDIILFGSTARGASAIESDVDLLLLLRRAPRPEVRRYVHEVVYPVSLFSDQSITLILLVRQAFVSWFKTQSRFAIEVVRDGVQLHGRFLEDARRK